MNTADDLERLRNVYAERSTRLAHSDIYSVFNRSYLFTWQQRQRSTIRAIAQEGITSFRNKKILEVGCGSGRVLAEYLSLGAQPQNLFGIDLLPDRLIDAHEHLPRSGIACADGQYLPYPGNSFDLVLQYTAFSSILNPDIKIQVGREMLRILNNDGYIVWYDFWLNPTNPQTRGIAPGEIRLLFPNCLYRYHKITLAPPITRRLVPISWIFAEFLESIKIFNSHYLVLIHKIT